MFCPTCGKVNSLDLKFCASCGTNLVAVSQALTGPEEDFFTRMDTGIDFLIGRYSEHVFKNAPHASNERKVAKSWQLLGQAALTSLIDLLLFVLMWNLLPLRLLILIVSTPFRLLAERNVAEPDTVKSLDNYRAPELPGRRPGLWIGDTAPSVTENTTKHLDSADTAASVITGQLE